MEKIPVYQHSRSYATEHNELEQYRASYQANMECRVSIETAIRDSYHSNCLGEDAGKQVVGQFGFDRVFYVLANTVRRKEWDGRFSRRNKEWADTVPVCEDEDAWGGDRNRYFVVDAVNPGLTDLFINQVRHEYLLTCPLTPEDIEKEAGRILTKLKSEPEPNSPGGTQYMAQISPEFLIRASTKDQDSLFALLPFRSLSISGLKDRSGLFAFISRKESRDRPLRLNLSAKLKGAREKSDAEARSSVPKQRETRQI